MDVNKIVKLSKAHRKMAHSISAETPDLIEKKATLPPKTSEMTTINLSGALTDIRSTMKL